MTPCIPFRGCILSQFGRSHERYFGAVFGCRIGNRLIICGTMMRSINPLSLAALIECAIRGMPPSGLMFLPGKPFEPPRAKMNPNILTMLLSMFFQLHFFRQLQSVSGLRDLLQMCTDLRHCLKSLPVSALRMLRPVPVDTFPGPH